MTNRILTTDSLPQEELAVTPPTKRLRIGITQGDTNGVGYELILKTFAEPTMFDLCVPVVFGHPKAAQQHRKTLGLQTAFHPVASAAEAVPERLNFVSCSSDELTVDFGRTIPEAGRAAFLSLEAAVAALRAGEIDALVTAPINKAGIQNSPEFHFVGHTEYLLDRFARLDSATAQASDKVETSPLNAHDADNVLMVLFNELMRVALVTTHLPLSEVPMAITADSVEHKLRLFHRSLCRDFGLSNPRIAVLSLNPHSGDGGLLGAEEEEIIKPVITATMESGITCFGPFAADGFFGAGLYKQFDGVLAMYHDQGLTALKSLSFGDGVNFTAGLPIVRTSPDHGTAYDIAGQGIAKPDSFRQAIYAAIDICRHRAAYDEAHKDPLPKLYQERKERG